MQVKTRKRLRFKGGMTIAANTVLTALPTTYPRFDQKHFDATGEYRWPHVDGFIVESPDVIVNAEDVVVL